MQKHAERTDKRPPIGMSTGGNRNVPVNSQLPGMTGDHPYWPKVSPDSAANLTDVMQHQQHHQTHTDFTIQHQNGHAELQPHHRGLIEHQQRGEENGEDLVVSRQQNSANGQSHNGQNLSLPPSSTPMSSAGSYDVITKTTTNSAFTPINTMPPHLNTLGHHHQLARQPYLYDAISFPNKNMPQNTSNSFPNQLISLHQIRNYAHQPSGLMAGEHLLGVSVGVGGKDKG
jgi:zinc finger protein 362/384